MECLLVAGKSLPKQLSMQQALRIVQIGHELEKLNFPDNLGGLLGGNLMSHILQLMEDARASKRESTS